MKYLIMSDVHGSYKEFKVAVENIWNPKEETLIVIGDLVDRGPRSYSVVKKCMELKEKYGDKVIILKGNHEQMLTSWLLHTHEDDLAFYYSDMHSITLKSFLGKDLFKSMPVKETPKKVLDLYRTELEFLDNLPVYHETENILFVHAGVNLNIKDWHEDEETMLWIRSEFYASKKEIGKKVFFGHTPLPHINKEENNYNVWENDSKTKVGIDGGVSMGGQLNVLRIDEKGTIEKEYKVSCK